MNQIQAALDRWIGERIEAVEAILDAQPNQQERREA